MKKQKIITVLLLLMLIGSMVTIFYITLILSRPFSSTSSIAPIKTKAQSVTYKKLIALKKTESTSTVIPSPTPSLTFTTSPEPTIEATVTPTEILLAYATATLSGEVKASPSTSFSSSYPTTISSIPESGYPAYLMIIFFVAVSFILFAFIF